MWADVKQDQVMFDPKEFESKFSMAPPKLAPVTDKGGAGASPHEPNSPGSPPVAQKKQLVTLIEGKRSYNIGIALARYDGSERGASLSFEISDDELRHSRCNPGHGREGTGRGESGCPYHLRSNLGRSRQWCVARPADVSALSCSGPVQWCTSKASWRSWPAPSASSRSFLVRLLCYSIRLTRLVVIPRLELRLKLWGYKQRFKAVITEAQNSLRVCETIMEACAEPKCLKCCVGTAKSESEASSGAHIGSGQLLERQHQGCCLRVLVGNADQTQGHQGFGQQVCRCMVDCYILTMRYRWTLLHFLVQSVANKCPKAREFVGELKEIEAAARLDLTALAGEVTKMGTTVRQIEGEIKKTADLQGDRFAENMREFLEANANDIKEVTARQKKIEENGTKLAYVAAACCCTELITERFSARIRLHCH